MTRGARPGTRRSSTGPPAAPRSCARTGDGLEALYLYRVLEGEDPLGYSRFRRRAARRHAARRRTTGSTARRGTEYPDLVVQLPEFFDSPRSPDVFVSPAERLRLHDGQRRRPRLALEERDGRASPLRGPRRALRPPPRRADRRPRAHSPLVPRRRLRPRTRWTGTISRSRRRACPRCSRSSPPRNDGQGSRRRRTRTVFVAPAAGAAPEISTIVAPRRGAAAVDEDGVAGADHAPRRVRDFGTRNETTSRRSVSLRRTRLLRRERDDRERERVLRHEARRPARTPCRRRGPSAAARRRGTRRPCAPRPP